MLVVLVSLDVAVQYQPVDPGAHVPEGTVEPPKASPLIKLSSTTTFDDLNDNKTPQNMSTMLKRNT